MANHLQIVGVAQSRTNSPHTLTRTARIPARGETASRKRARVKSVIGAKVECEARAALTHKGTALWASGLNEKCRCNPKILFVLSPCLSLCVREYLYLWVVCQPVCVSSPHCSSMWVPSSLSFRPAFIFGFLHLFTVFSFVDFCSSLHSGAQVQIHTYIRNILAQWDKRVLMWVWKIANRKTFWMHYHKRIPTISVSWPKKWFNRMHFWLYY